MQPIVIVIIVVCAAALIGLGVAVRRLRTDLAAARAQVESLRRELEQSIGEARTDGLTDIANRRAFDRELNRSFAQRQRQDTIFSLILVDVDHFKRFNDQHGHRVGDDILQTIADRLSRATRTMDLVARYGGDEFAVILPGTDLAAACVASQRLCACVSEQILRVVDAELRLTVSTGVAAVSVCETADELVDAADAALYAAKNAGRNRGYFHDGQSCRPVDAHLTEPDVSV